MSAYVIIEAAVKDSRDNERYALESQALVQAFGGEVVMTGAWFVLSGETEFPIGAIIRFPDAESALDWYRSPDFKALLTLRDAAMESRFRLLG